jgi:hypothetical protein
MKELAGQLKAAANMEDWERGPSTRNLAGEWTSSNKLIIKK